MDRQSTCFVIIGYGKKTSYAGGRTRILDLDETYTILIKPVFDALGITCYRAIDKNISGSIDKLMLQEIRNADICIVDISTLNANVMWELGVRHALRPQHTIMICEKEQMASIPFDVNHFVVHQYAHSEEGIPYKEVERFRAALTSVVKGVLQLAPTSTDSPVFTFLEKEMAQSKGPAEAVSEEVSFATLMTQAEEAKNKKDYARALDLFAKAEKAVKSNMTLKDSLSLIVSRQALCMYKSKQPTELEALGRAQAKLEELAPNETRDLEVLGLCGAVNKRLYELGDDPNHLNKAIAFYEKGFQLKQDYYNGINTAFMLYKKASLPTTPESDLADIRVKADYIRNTVLDLALAMEKDADFSARHDATWVLFTIAEAYNYKGNTERMAEYETKAKAMAEQRQEAFAIDSYGEQKARIQAIFNR
jgi:hypothetical protein